MLLFVAQRCRSVKPPQNRRAEFGNLGVILSPDEVEAKNLNVEMSRAEAWGLSVTRVRCVHTRDTLENGGKKSDNEAMQHTKSLLFALLCLAPGAVLLAQAPGQNAAGSKHGSSSLPGLADVAKGRKLFDANCAICHYSASAAKKIGPGLKELSKRGRYVDGKAVDEASLRVWIEKGGKDMPGFKDSLNAEHVRELIAYLKTL